MDGIYGAVVEIIPRTCWREGCVQEERREYVEFVCNTRKLTAIIVSLKIMQECAESKKVEYYVEKYCNVKRIWKFQLVMEIWNIAVKSISLTKIGIAT